MKHSPMQTKSIRISDDLLKKAQKDAYETLGSTSLSGYVRYLIKNAN